MKRTAMVVCGSLAFAGVSTASGDSLAWTGGGTVDKTDWFEAGNWDLNRIPAAGDDVVINPPAGAAYTINLTNSTPKLKSLLVRHQSPSKSLNQKTWLTCHNWDTKIEAEAVTVGRGGIITCNGPFLSTENASRVWIVSTDLVFDDMSEDFAGRIDVNRKGYLDRPVVEDSISCPAYPGLGRAKGDNNALYAGGGAVKIELTGDLTFLSQYNQITACCDNKDSLGSGNGGSVYVKCRTIKGGGRIDAFAADRISDSANNGSKCGDGGKVALDYDCEAQRAIMPQALRINVRAGSQAYFAKTPYSTTICGPANLDGCGNCGSVWLKDRQFLELSELRIAGIWHFGTGTPEKFEHNGDLALNMAYLEFAEPIPMHVKGCLSVIGNESVAGVQEKELCYGIRAEAGLTVDGDMTVAAARVTMAKCDLVVGGNLMLTNETANTRTYNGGVLVVKPRQVGAGEIGATVAVGGAFVLGPHTQYQPQADADDGSICKLTARSVDVARNGVIFADMLGYAARTGTGKGMGQHQGASYGGAGAYDIYGTKAETYGSEDNPLEPGSGGGYAGGGSVVLDVKRGLNIDGLVTASANLGDKNSYYGGGSGGAVNIKCGKISGSGQILAKGGWGDGTSGACAGGGGRIAVSHRGSDLTTGLREGTTAPAGVQGKVPAELSEVAQDGTVVWNYNPLGFMLLLK